MKSEEKNKTKESIGKKIWNEMKKVFMDPSDSFCGPYSYRGRSSNRQVREFLMLMLGVAYGFSICWFWNERQLSARCAPLHVAPVIQVEPITEPSLLPSVDNPFTP